MDSKALLRAANAADAAAAAETPEQERAAVMAVMREKEAMRIGMMYAQLGRISESPHLQERLPVRDEGDDIGVVEASIPAELFFRLGLQKNFGWDGWHSDEGIRDVLKAHPFCKVKTVSGKTTVSMASPSRRAPGVTFGRGTMQFAT